MDNKDNLKDEKVVERYIGLLGFHFRRFKVLCDKCEGNKTDKKYFPIFNDLWNLIHTLPFVLNTDISTNYRLKMLVVSFFNKIKFLPCKSCKDHYSAYLRQYPLTDIKTNKELHKWTVDLHNNVNRRLNKNIVMYEKARYIYMNLNI